MKNRVLNFSAGPATLPMSILDKIHGELYNFNNTGASVMELSHRSEEIQFIIDDSVSRIKKLMGLGKEFEVILIQGGGTLQFASIPLCFSNESEPVDYIDSGYWSKKAIYEAQLLNRDVKVIASSEDSNHTVLPEIDSVNVRPESKYLHMCSNNTVVGTQWQAFPKVNIPLCIDISSDFLSKEFDLSGVDMVYAHAQKNAGIAGVTVVIIRNDMLSKIPDGIPSIVDYRTHIKANSNYHTPPCFSIYVTWLYLQWLEEEIGSLRKMAEINQKKANLLYDFIDNSNDFYQCFVEKPSRSYMNVRFTLGNDEIDNIFVDEAEKSGFIGVGGHRSIKGCRISLFNGVTLDAVEKIIEFMSDFKKSHMNTLLKAGEMTSG